MPVIVLAAFAFPAGLVAGLLIPWSAWILAPLVAAGAFVGARQRMAIGLSCAAAGILWGAGARREREADCRLAWREGDRLTVLAEPRDRAAPAPAGAVLSPRRFDILSPAECAGQVLVQLPRGDTTEGVVVLVGTWRRDPSFTDARLPRRVERAGRLVALVVRPVAERPGLRSRLRVGAERRLEVLFGDRRWPLAAALTVSPEASLPRELRQQFSRAGLTHILSISGLHVGLLAGALIVVLRAVRLSASQARIVGTIAVAGYLWLLGFPAPALRSAGLLALWCWARERQRPPLTGAMLATTVLVVTLIDPWTVFEPGPWLSFAGVWGCAAASRWWDRVLLETRGRRERRRLRWLGPAVVSTGAVLATTPIQVLAFGTITPVAVAANLVAIPIAAFATPALALALLLATIPGAMPAAGLVASATGAALDALELVARQAAAVPWASFAVDTPVFLAVATAILAWWLLRHGGGRRPAAHVLLARCGGASLVALACISWSPALAALGASDGDGRLTLHFLSVGQGDATAIRTPNGHWILIDGGPRAPGLDAGARRVVPFLRRRGARRIDVLVASHGDADHLGGLPAVVAAVPAWLVIEPGTPLGRPLYLEWLSGVAVGRARWHAARAGERLVVDGVTVRIWHPDSATIAAGWEPNENSVVLTVEYGAFRAVFGGDAGLPMEALRAGQVGRVTLLKVGHHGSRSASGEAWLAALRPAVCVIQVGARNRYGHPDIGVVARLRDAGCGVWRTDREGDVTVTTDGRSVFVQGAGRDSSFLVSKEHP